MPAKRDVVQTVTVIKPNGTVETFEAQMEVTPTTFNCLELLPATSGGVIKFKLFVDHADFLEGKHPQLSVTVEKAMISLFEGVTVLYQ